MNEHGSRTNSRASIPELPPELILNILDYFPEEQYKRTWKNVGDPLNSGTRNRQRMLAKMSRVCRLWHEALIPLLLRALHITSVDQARHLGACLEGRKTFGEMVRVIKLTTNVCAFHIYKHPHLKILLQQCPNLEGLLLWLTGGFRFREDVEYILSDVLASPPQLKRITLKNFGTCGDKFSRNIPSIFPLLEFLEFTGMIVKELTFETTLILLRECKSLCEPVLQKRFEVAEMRKLREPDPQT
ncbi:hypothetical protein DFS34DRAFT_634428 [Phlyctochytrium arcticum]|nr:hypothetical protein DFS34DRAFT_634428 [Phlyctochytrium arcticum]